MNKKLSIEIQGMNCPSCEKIITQALQKLPGISDVVVYKDENRGVLEADLSIIDTSQIIQTIEEAGYSAQIIEDGNSVSRQIQTRDQSSSACPILSQDQCISINPKIIPSKINQQRVTLSLSGMHCASCAAIIERSLNKKNGVIRATVNFAAEKATVLFDHSVTNPTELIDVVKKAGYDARVITPEDREKEKQRKREEVMAQWRIFLMSLFLSSPMMYFMFLDFFKWLPGAITLPPYFGIISLVLTIPVQFIIGSRFYRGMWSSLRMKTFNMDSLVAIGTTVAFGYSLFHYLSYIYETSSML
ncbi:MAG: heavy metal translocating P-type ATPase, partial [Candidatus Atribacteria bacterium]|nr:heavy metal translocating P-type ATPase [Candidatus Atribacteria bacterium]